MLIRTSSGIFAILRYLNCTREILMAQSRTTRLSSVRNSVAKDFALYLSCYLVDHFWDSVSSTAYLGHQEMGG